MATYITEKLIDQLQAKTEAILNKAIGEWQLIPHSRFARKPSADAWSANECLQHINSYGRYYLPAIERALSQSTNGTTSSKEFSSGWLGGYFTKIMTPLADGKLPQKMKSPRGHFPKTILESHLVISEFIDQQEKLLKLLSEAKKIDLNKARVGISIAPFIKLKLGDVLMFLIAHIIRHAQQAERVLEKN